MRLLSVCLIRFWIEEHCMANTEEKLARSLTAESTELIAFLPYLLQDLWDLGSSPEDMIELISRHVGSSAAVRVLDLACGKGSVSVRIAQVLGCRVKGIDIMTDFIDYAREKAEQYSVSSLCAFSVGDITEAVMIEKDYDVVILGAVGDVLGPPDKTIEQLKSTIRPGGYILIDDGYGKQGSEIDYYTRDEWLDICRKCGVRMVDELLIADEKLERINAVQQRHIRRRCEELMKKYPEQAHLFESYIASQRAECDMLEQDITGVTMLLQGAGDV